jgi:hypothetical protein
VVLSFGRFNPPHRGHKLLLDKMVETAKQTPGAQAVLFVNPKQNNEKDPLLVGDKIKYLKAMQPGLSVESKPKEQIPDPQDVIKLYSDRGYKHLTLVEGGDREKWFHDLIDPRMNDGTLKFKDWKFVSAGDRASDEMWSATQQRDAVRKGDYKGFRSGLPKEFPEKLAREMYDKVGMSLAKGMPVAAAEPEEDTWPRGWGDGDEI